MKSVGKYYSLMILLVLFSLDIAAQNAFTAQDKAVIATFEGRVKKYINLREQRRRQLPKIPKKATPEQIEFHKTALQKLVQTQRNGAKQGDIFTPEASVLIRRIIKNEFKGRDRIELRKDVLFEAETKGVPVKVNVGYPESKEVVEMPPTLLLALPQLPEQLNYRFVGTNLLLMDKENYLIVDYMTNAIP
jgi:hypothetical protein